MKENEIQEQELRNMIEQSVDESVNRAFKKYGRFARLPRFSLRGLVSLIVLVTLLVAGVYLHERSKANDAVAR